MFYVFNVWSGMQKKSGSFNECISFLKNFNYSTDDLGIFSQDEAKKEKLI